MVISLRRDARSVPRKASGKYPWAPNITLTINMEVVKEAPECDLYVSNTLIDMYVALKKLLKH